MTITAHTAAEVRTALVAFCKKHKLQAKAAKALNLTPSQLSLALSSKGDFVPAKIVQKLGYRAVTAYVPRGKKTVVAKKARKVSRNVKSGDKGGEFVSATYAEQNPDTTVTETVPITPVVRFDD